MVGWRKVGGVGFVTSFETVLGIAVVLVVSGGVGSKAAAATPTETKMTTALKILILSLFDSLFDKLVLVVALMCWPCRCRRRRYEIVMMKRCVSKRKVWAPKRGVLLEEANVVGVDAVWVCCESRYHVCE